MNKGILVLSLVFSFSGFSQAFKSNADFAKTLISKCKQWGGTHNVENKKVSIDEKTKVIRECANVSCSLSTANAQDISISEFRSTFSNMKETTAGMFGYVQSCINKGKSSDSDEFIKVATGDDSSINVNISEVISKCKKGKCPNGYRIDLEAGVIYGPGGFSININGDNTIDSSNNNDADITISGNGGNDQGQVRCPKSGCWYEGRRVSGTSLLSSCFKKLKIKKIGKFLGIFKKKNTGKYRIKYKVKRGCEGAWSAVVDDLSGAITISGSGKGHRTISKRVSKRKSRKGKANVEYKYERKGKGKGNIEIDDDLEGWDDIEGDEEFDTRGGKYVWVHDGNTQVKCEYTRSWRDECLGANQYNKIISMHGEILHCINCEHNKLIRGRNSIGFDAGAYGRSAGGILNGVANLFGSVAPSVFGYLSTKATANAAVDIAERCASMQNSYQTNAYNFISSNEITLADSTGAEIAVPECNGYPATSFAGTGGFYGNGFGGFTNPYLGRGYSSGYLGHFSGPYSQFGNPYTGGRGLGFNLNGNLGLGLGRGSTPGFGGPRFGGFGISGGFGGQGFGGQGFGGQGFGGRPGFGNFGLSGSAGYGLNGSANGIVPWRANGGNFSNFGNINQSYQSNQQAQAQGSFLQQQALANQAQSANQNFNSYYNNSYNGYSPSYSPTNFGLNWNFNAGF